MSSILFKVSEQLSCNAIPEELNPNHRFAVRSAGIRRGRGRGLGAECCEPSSKTRQRVCMVHEPLSPLQKSRGLEEI